MRERESDPADEADAEGDEQAGEAPEPEASMEATPVASRSIPEGLELGLRLIGGLLLVLAIGVTVFVLPPAWRGSWVRYVGIALGALASLLFRGIKPLWSHRAQTPGWVWGLGLALGLTTVGLAFAVRPTPTTVELELTTRALPGMEIDLPAWESDPEHRAGPASTKLMDPWGPEGRSIIVEAERGGLVPLEVWRSMFAELGLDVARAHQRADGRGFDQRLLAPNGNVLVHSALDCGDHSISVMTFVDLEPEELERFHQRIVSSARCVEWAETDAGLPPEFTPPAGYVLDSETTSSRTWVNPTLDAVFVSETAGGQRVAEGFAQEPMRRGAMRLLVPDAELRMVPRGHAVAGERMVWEAHAIEGELRSRVLIMTWYCEEVDRSMMLEHVGPLDAPLADSLEVMGRARCPDR